MTMYEKEKSKTRADLADVFTRFIALVIDGIILGIISGVLTVFVREPGFVLSFLIGVTYHWYFLTRNNGQTLGKQWMSIRVVKRNGAPLETADVVVRYGGYWLNSFVLGIGWIWALFDADRQGWHDKLAGTVVVRA